MMNELMALRDELQIIHEGDAWHGPSLHEILAGISAAQAAAHPIPAAHSIWELVVHIAAWEETFCRRLQGQAKVEPDAGDFPAVTETSETAWQQALQTFDRIHQQFIAQVAALSESDLDQQVAGKDYTVRYLLHGTVRHHVYHAGQIALLKRSLG